MENAIEIRHLAYSYPDDTSTEHVVFQDLSLDIEQGSFVAVLGHNGCGKSTLGRVILHLLDSTDGQILFEGEDVTHVDKAKLRALREKMQIIFQDPYSSLNPRMSVSEIIMEPLQLKGGMSHAEMYEKTKS